MNTINPVDARCLGCHMPDVEMVLDLGQQPPSNLFLGNATQQYPTHPLRFGVCTSCGLAQILDPMPENMVRCTHDWLRYDEPEQHLDDLASYLSSAVGKQKPQVCGASYKDATLLNRLESYGWKASSALAASHAQPQADVLIARHILEHARNPQQFIAICSAMIRPNGLLVFEVPGFERMLQQHQHCFLWEEHILYFTRANLKDFLRSCNLEVLEVLEYPLPLENSIVAIARPAQSVAPAAYSNKDSLDEQLGMIRSFGSSLHNQGAKAQEVLKRAFRAGKAISLFGAGHLGMKYIHFYGLEPFLETVLDDHPQKRGTFLPGSLLPVNDSSWLAQHPEGICLVAVNPEKHAILQQRHAFFSPGGGKWHSIFSDLSDFGL